MDNRMETCNITPIHINKKKKYINASAIIIAGEGYVPKDLPITNNGGESKPEDDTFLKEISSHHYSYRTTNSLQNSVEMDIYPLKVHFICSKDPMGVGRFGVVYKASNIEIKLPKRKLDLKCDTFVQKSYNELRTQLGDQSSLAVKMIRNKSLSSASSNSRKTSKRAINNALKHNKELSILKLLHHENVIQLFYFSCDDVRKDDVEDDITSERNICDHESSIKRNETTLSLFLSLMPTTLQLCLEKQGSLIKGEVLSENRLGLAFVKQLYTALDYIRSLNICHRDIKPSNILLDIDNQLLKLSDFGSAIQLRPKTDNNPEKIDNTHLQSYVCSRYYRAPELILGSKKYGCEIDIWSAGCVVAEMVMTRPLFSGI